MRVIFTMRRALSDPELLGDVMPGQSWFAWRCLLIAFVGEPLTSDDEREAYRRLTLRDDTPSAMGEALVAVVGRRGGKSKAAAVLMVWLACCCDWTDSLSIGEEGVALIVAPTERQAAVTAGYIRKIIKSKPLLAALVTEETQQTFKLLRNVAIEILAANARWVRGITCIGVALDESAFLPSNEDAANSDASLMDALQPTVATTGGPMLLTSSPQTTTGVVHELWEEFYGKAGADVLVVQAGTRDLNPTVRQSVIDKARARDGRTADREYGGQFIEPVAAYIDRETLLRCTEKGVLERVAMANVQYSCFIDAAAGTGQDSFAVAIGHRARDKAGDIIMLDALIGQKPPFDPMVLVKQLAAKLRALRITSIMGDNFTGGFLVSAFREQGIEYLRCPLSASDLYLAALPTFTSQTISLIDSPGLVDELVSLRRKFGTNGKETVTHMRGRHDDAANALCGLIYMLTPAYGGSANKSWGGFGVYTGAPGVPVHGPDGSNTPRQPQLGDPYQPVDEADRRRLAQAKELREKARMTVGEAPPQQYRGLLW
jgi:hypothetical protein